MDSNAYLQCCNYMATNDTNEKPLNARKPNWDKAERTAGAAGMRRTSG